MREIEFRGKIRNEDTEEWFYGDLLQDTVGNMYIITKDYTPKPDGLIELNTCQSPKLDPETVGQYTGEKDSKGNKVYTGDIVRSGEEIGLVVFDENYLGYFVNLEEQQPLYDVFIEVIGNIHDNPELLESGNYADNDTMLPATE